MGALIFIVASTLLLLLGPLLGFLLLALRRTRRTAAFFLFLPTSATGDATFGFWLLERLLHARVSPQQALEASFYLGYVPFYALGLTLALAALLFRPHGRRGAWLKGVINGAAAGFVVLSCMMLLAIAQIGIASRHQAGSVGWDPISIIGSAPAWRIVPAMLVAFVAVFIWSTARMRAPAS